MLLTDTHTHQYYETDPVIQHGQMARCIQEGVSRLFLPNVDSESVHMVLDLVQKFPENCFAMMGLHPCSVKEDFKIQLGFIEEIIQKHKIYAIGEIGIDLYWDKTTLEIQKEAFRRQLRQAKKLRLPVSIHCREAFDEVYPILIEEQDEDLNGIFHCFTGTKKQADQIIDLGFYLGIGGVVTYKNSGLDKVVAELELKHLVLETDSPYLTPVPHRGKPNESSYICYIAQKVADLKQLSVEEVGRITTENSMKIFGV